MPLSSTSEISAVVLAGGFGTRVRHLLPGIPKPIAPVFGRSFLDWIIAFLRRGGIQSCVFSTGHLADVIASHYASGQADGVEVECVRIIDDPVLARESGRRARTYAEREFDIDHLAESFEGMILKPFKNDNRFKS